MHTCMCSILYIKAIFFQHFKAFSIGLSVKLSVLKLDYIKQNWLLLQRGNTNLLGETYENADSPICPLEFCRIYSFLQPCFLVQWISAFSQAPTNSKEILMHSQGNFLQVQANSILSLEYQILTLSIIPASPGCPLAVHFQALPGNKEYLLHTEDLAERVSKCQNSWLFSASKTESFFNLKMQTH